MKLIRLFFATFALILILSAAAPAQNSAPANSPSKSAAASSSAPVPPAEAAAIGKRMEAFFRNIFALGPAIDVSAGPIVPAEVPGFYDVTVKITVQGQTSLGRVYVSKDGRYMLRGEIQDFNQDPLEEVRKQIHLDGYASKGPADAKVTIVEYGDLQCPSCRQFETALRAILPQYPQVRFVFKDFPLEQVHPWAKTAAIAAHCVLNQSSDAFWKFHDTIYDDQDQVTTENAYDKLGEFAAAAGADPAAYKACVADPATLQIVEKSQEEGRELGVTGTPTTFVNGRRITGPDGGLLQQYLDYDLGGTATQGSLGTQPSAASAPRSATTK